MMLKHLLGTAGTRILNAIINLVILVLLTNKIGSEGLGIIALIILDIVIIQLVIDLVAGSAVVFYASRFKIGSIVWPAYLWIAMVVALFYFTGAVVENIFPGFFNTVVPMGYAADILALASINAIMLLHYNVLLGRKKINTYNRIFGLQILSMLLVFLIQIYYLNNLNVSAYVSALYIAYGIGALSSVYAAYKGSQIFEISDWKPAIRKVLSYGLSTQLANIMFMGNKRLSFYLIKYYLGLKPLGIYTAGNQLTEGLKLIGQSISMVQFSTISNTTDEEYARQLSIKLMKFTVLITAVAMGTLMLIPFSIYSYVFGSEFDQMKVVIYALGPGMVALAVTTIFSAYFSGKGLPQINLNSNIIGLIFTTLFAILLIPSLGILGGALTASISFTVSSIYQYFVFRKMTKTILTEWFIRKSDFADFLNIIRDVSKK